MTGEPLTIQCVNKKLKDFKYDYKVKIGNFSTHTFRKTFGRYVYENNKRAYDDYIPKRMLGASNDFYNFMEDSYYVFKKEDGVSLKVAWEMYKAYCSDSNIPYPCSKRVFKEELMNYFREYKERVNAENGDRIRRQV